MSPTWIKSLSTLSGVTKNNVFSEYSDTPILHNQLGDSAGVFGADLL